MKKKPKGKESADVVTGWLCSALKEGETFSKNTLRDILSTAMIDASEGVDRIMVAPYVVAHFKRLAEKSTRQRDNALERKSNAEAEMAEIALQERLGKLVSVPAAKSIVETALVDAREKIRRLDGLSMEAKNAVCEVLSKMELKLPEEME